MIGQQQRESLFDAWLLDIQADYPGCYVRQTRDGCAVYKIANDELVTEEDYEPDPHEAARVRH